MLQFCDFTVVNRTNYPLSVIVAPNAQLLLKIIYDRRYFDAATITRMLGHLQTLLVGMVANPQQRLQDLPLLTETVVFWNASKLPKTSFM